MTEIRDAAFSDLFSSNLLWFSGLRREGNGTRKGRRRNKEGKSRENIIKKVEGGKEKGSERKREIARIMKRKMDFKKKGEKREGSRMEEKGEATNK